MSEPAAPRSTRRWWDRPIARILALGALAAALGSILALPSAFRDLWPDPPPKTDANISIEIDPEIPLSEAQARLKATLSQGVGSGMRQDQPAPVRRLQPDSSATTQADPSSTVATDPSSSGAAETTASSGTASSVDVIPGSASRPQLSAIQEALTKKGDPIVDRDCRPPPCVVLARAIRGYSVGPDGKPVDPEVAAERIIELLQDTRHSDGDGSGPSEPLGIYVTANVQLIGLKGQEVKLSWSMFGGKAGNKRLHGQWLNDNAAHRLKAERDDDIGVVAMWIPLPRSAGPYWVEVRLKVNGRPLRIVKSDPIS